MRNLKYLQKIGVTHVLNTAENDVRVNPQKYKQAGFGYHGFCCPGMTSSINYSEPSNYNTTPQQKPSLKMDRFLGNKRP